jgi:Mg2+ and Co2+ transporter CorA
MSNYLDSDSLRRQANTVVRLTVVTTFGLIGTLSTGFLGMNLIDAADASLLNRALLFLLFFVPSTAFILYFIVKSKPLSEFLEALSDDRLAYDERLRTLSAVWRERRRRSP